MPWDLHDDVWRSTIHFLRRSPRGRNARRVLSTLNAIQLFRIALLSQKLYGTVAAYLDHLQISGPDVEYDADVGAQGNEDGNEGVDSTNGKNRLPTALGLRLLKDFALADHLRSAQISRDGALAAAAALQAAASSVLKRFDLTFGETRLMQTATGAVISGSSIPSLMATRTKFDPVDLDVYTGRGGGFDVMRYLSRSGKYMVESESPTYDFAAGIGKVYTMRHHKTSKKINVIESLTKNPLDAVAHFHSTCVFGAWTASGFWHAYAQLTFAGVSLTTPSRLPLRDDIEQHRRVWRILHKYHSRGFTFAAEHSPPHTCGVDLDCPCTMRSSDDDGCLFAAFPAWEFNNDVVEMRPVSWSLGGVGCASGILARAGSASAPAVAYWTDMVKGYSECEAFPGNDILTMRDLFI